MGVPAEIHALLERFERNRLAYISGEYNETQLRREFLDPFFIALGWDVENKQGYAEAYKDVVHEDAIKIGTATKAPDYSFRIGGVRKFFVEVKKPSVNLKEDISPAYQVRRYAWSAKLPLSILTDFEEFAVYDCRIKPNARDKSSVGRIMYFRYTEYLDHWDEIASIFSREAVLKGSFDKYVESTKGKKGTAEVDDAFLKEIESWRESLAKNIALRNPKLSVRDLNFAVQRIIDRIIFLRICEDRGIQTYGALLALTGGTRIYKRLCEIFYRADEKYNSGLFHFQKEKDRPEPPDEFTLQLEIDDKPVKDIIKSLYYPDSSYEFSVLPADILGQVYEQFLGKVIRLTAGHQAKVEDKPEVKKAGGVYYTPTYIVDYIVKNTVGKLLAPEPSEGLRAKSKKPSEGLHTLTPRQASKLRILDPACGSGSFLIGAYQYLLDWHRDWYVNDGVEKWTKGKNPTLYQAQGAEWRLTTAERKRILLNNIYGVDIDPQAVEVTKLSLLLKVLEGENEQTLARQLKIFHERALPDLSSNIKCGNSLIGPDFYEGRQLSLMDDEERLKINAFDWKKEFKEIMDAGGFDSVIGNPPYILLQILDQRPVFDYLAKSYRSATYKIDTYQVFIERGISVTRDGGKLGYITPNTFLRNKFARQLRELILEESNVDTLRIFYYPVFRGASVDTSIIILTPNPKANPKHEALIVQSRKYNAEDTIKRQLQENWSNHPERHFSLFSSGRSLGLISKIGSKSTMLREIATAYFGIQTFDREKFVSTKKQTKRFNPVVDGTNIQRYSLLPSSEFVDFRPEAIKSGGKEYVYEQLRIGVRQIGEIPIATMLPAGLYTLNTIYNIFFTKKTDYDLHFVLGLICSKANCWYWKQCFFDQKETFPKVKKDALLSILLPRINFSDPADKSRHDRMVAFVETMLDLNKKLSAAKTEHEQTALKRQIETTDNQIDELVYELYGLTEEEIRIVEGM